MKTGDQVTAKTLEPEGDAPRNLKGTLEIRTYPASEYYPAFTAYFVDGIEADHATITVTDKKDVEILSGERFLDHLRAKATEQFHYTHDQSTHGSWSRGEGSATSRVAALKLPKGKYAVAGSAWWDIKGLRRSKDLDIVVTPDVYEDLRQKGWKEIDHGHFTSLSHYSNKTGWVQAIRSDRPTETAGITPDLDRWISEAEVVDGVPVVQLQELYALKKAYNRPKDRADIAAMDEVLRSESKALVAHGSHDQKSHGNWAKGTRDTVGIADNPQDKFFFPGVSVSNETRLRDTIDSIAKVHDLPANLPKSSVEVRQTGMGTADGVYHPDKKTIYMADGSDIMRFGFVHEFGHHLTMVDGGLVYPENSGNTLETKGPGRWRMEVMGSGVGKKASDLAPVIEAIEKTQAYKAIQERALRAVKQGQFATEADNFAVYLGDPRELFARSYAQWIATRSNDQQLYDEFSRFRSRTDAHDMQWRDNDFAIVAEALEDYFRGRSLTASATQFHSCDTHDCDTHGNWADLTQVTTHGLDKWPKPLRDKLVARAAELQQKWGVKVTLDGRESATTTRDGKTVADPYNIAEEYEALAAVPPGDTTIYLNPQLVIDSWRARQMKTTQQVALARTLADVITHEYGHALQGELERREAAGDKAAGAALQELKRPFLDALDVDEPGEEYDRLASEVSFYATDTVDEGIAEAFLQHEKSGGKEKFQSSWSQHVTDVFNSQFRKEES